MITQTRTSKGALLSLAALILLAFAGCGSDDSSGSSGTDGTDGATGTDGTTGTVLPSVTITKQEQIEASAWDAAVSSNADLKTVADRLVADGLTDVVASGESGSDDGSVVTWAVYSNGTQESTAALGCTDGACRAVSISVSGGKAVFTGADGQTAEPLMVAAPVMLKEVEGGDISGKTTLVTALTADDVPVVNLHARRFTLANAYGDVFGLTWNDVAAMAEKSGAFTEVNNAQYANRAVLTDAIGHASPFDVLVWVGASVRQPFGPDTKTVGMTVNRGIYGDETFTAADVKALLKEAPYGGPGLILLVGEQSRGDGSEQENKPQSLVNELVEVDGSQIVVGMTGRAKTQDVLDSSQLFLTTFMGGATLEASLAAANTLLEGRGSSATLRSNNASKAANITFVGDLSKFWGEGTAPKAVKSNHFLNVNNICVPANGDPYSEPEAPTNFFVELDFDGPFFSGTRMWENGDAQLHATVEGVLLGRNVGDTLYMKFSGDLKPSVFQLTVWGSGHVVEPQAVDEPPAGRTYYDGEAIATDYVNGMGDTCTLKTPTLTGSTSSQQSWMDLPPEP